LLYINTTPHRSNALQAMAMSAPRPKRHVLCFGAAHFGMSAQRHKRHACSLPIEKRIMGICTEGERMPFIGNTDVTGCDSWGMEDSARAPTNVKQMLRTHGRQENACSTNLRSPGLCCCIFMGAESSGRETARAWREGKRWEGRKTLFTPTIYYGK
jgi:hypothetical protein